MDAFSELKGLADTADGIINIQKNHKNRLDEWFSLFKQAALDIVSDKNKVSETNNEAADKRKLPDIVPFVSETEIVVKQLPRISSALACLQKDHIVHVQRKTLARASKSETKDKSPEQQPSTFNATFVRFTTPENNTETPLQNDTSNKSVVNEDENQEFFTPVGQNPELSELQTKTGRPSRKRKSSSPMYNTASYKKVKVLNSASVSIKNKSLRKSLRGIHGKVSDTKFMKFHNRLPSTKISSSGMNSSVLKENRRVKTETEDNEHLKKVLAARQIKAQEAKRKREEKMEKISQQRLKLEKEKDERLKGRKTREVEKPLLKTVLDSKKKRARDVEKNHNSEEVSEPPSAKRTRAKNTGTPTKTPRQVTLEKENKMQKTQDIKTYKGSEVKSDSRATEEIKQKNGTPRKPKGTKVTVEENVNKKEDMNTTYSAKSPSPEIKKTSGKPVGPVKEIFKTPVAPQRVISTTATAITQATTVTKPNVDKSTSLAKQAQSKNTSQASSAYSQSQSYEMTPARSSFVNYDVSEIKSDDSDDDDDSKRNQKPVPGWASGVRLKNALVQQQYRPIDTDLIFGNVFDTPDLVDIMGVKSKRYFKRTSSAVWNSPSAFL